MASTQTKVAPQAPAAERRRHPRTPVQCSVQLRSPDRPGSAPIDGTLVDFSACGVGIRLSGPLAPGKEFLLNIPTAADKLANLQYRVVRCCPLGRGGFHIGAVFIRPARPSGT